MKKNGTIILVVALVVGAMTWLTLPFFTDQRAGLPAEPARHLAASQNPDSQENFSTAASLARRQARTSEIVRALAAVEAALHVASLGGIAALLEAPVGVLLDSGEEGAVALRGLIDQAPPGEGRSALLAIVAVSWATRDPEKAVAWAAQQPNAAERELALERVCLTAADRDSQKALELTLPVRFDDRLDTLAEILVRWSLREPDEARSWALGQPDGEDRSYLLSRLIELEGQRAPEEAARLAFQALPAGELLDETLIAIARTWANQDAEAAARWVQTFPEGDFRDRVVREVGRNLLSTDGDAPASGQ